MPLTSKLTQRHQRTPEFHQVCQMHCIVMVWSCSSSKQYLCRFSIFQVVVKIDFRKSNHRTDGTESDHCNVEKPWQAASRAAAADGMAADLFWQWGDTLSSGKTHNDGNTIYYGSSDAQCLVTDHVKAIG